MKIEKENKIYHLELSEEELYVLLMKFELVGYIPHQFELSEYPFKIKLQQFCENNLT